MVAYNKPIISIIQLSDSSIIAVKPSGEMQTIDIRTQWEKDYSEALEYIDEYFSPTIKEAPHV